MIGVDEGGSNYILVKGRAPVMAGELTSYRNRASGRAVRQCSFLSSPGRDLNAFTEWFTGIAHWEM